MRAFAIRFVTTGVFVLALVPVIVLADGRGWWPWQGIVVFVVGAAMLMAVGGHVGDFRRWEGASFGGSDDRPWREILFGNREEQLRMSRERVFRNSARAGFVTLGLALLWLGLGVSSDARFPLQLLLAALFAWTGTRQLWAGWRRWRAGGEFNYPPREADHPDGQRV